MAYANFFLSLGSPSFKCSGRQRPICICGCRQQSICSGIGSWAQLCTAFWVTDWKTNHNTFISKIPFLYPLKAACTLTFAYLWPRVLESKKNRFQFSLLDDRREQTGSISLLWLLGRFNTFEGFWSGLSVTWVTTLGSSRIAFAGHFSSFCVCQHLLRHLMAEWPLVVRSDEEAQWSSASAETALASYQTGTLLNNAATGQFSGLRKECIIAVVIECSSSGVTVHCVAVAVIERTTSYVTVHCVTAAVIECSISAHPVWQYTVSQWLWLDMLHLVWQCTVLQHLWLDIPHLVWQFTVVDLMLNISLCSPWVDTIREESAP